MRRLKKYVALAVASAMAITMIAGCGGNKEKDKVNSEGTTAAQATQAPKNDPYAEKLEISVALWAIGEAIQDGVKDEMRDAVYKKFNITLKPFNVTWNDYVQKIQTWALSKQLPDFFAADLVTDDLYEDWEKQGIIRALPKDLSKYPNIKSVVESEGSIRYKRPLGDPNGKYHAIPRLNHRTADEWCNDMGLLIRKDWMENVGIKKVPENMDEFITLMKAFVEKDPDKNGKNDTIGLTTYDVSKLDFLMGMYQPGALGGICRDEEKPGQWIPAILTKDYMEGLKAVNKLFAAGGLDKDFATIKEDEGMDRFANSKAGAICNDATLGSLTKVAGKFEKANQGKKLEDSIVIMKPFKREKDGKYYRQIANTSWSETFISAKTDDKKIDRFLALYDYLLSEEGYNLVRYGYENKDWKKEGGKIVLTPQKDAQNNDIPLKTLYPFSQISHLTEWSGTKQWDCPTNYPKLQTMANDHRDWMLKNAVAPAVDLRIGSIKVKTTNKTTLDYSEFIVQCIMSKDTEKTFNQLVKEARDKGYNEYIEVLNKETARLGIK